MVFILLNAPLSTNSTHPPFDLRRGKRGPLGDVTADNAGVVPTTIRFFRRDRACPVRSIMWLFIAVLAMTGTTITAQSITDTPTDPMQTDETRLITLDGENPTELTYVAVPGEVITISGRSLETDADNPAIRDVVLTVLTVDGDQLAYNDNHNSDRDDLAPGDARIERLLLPDAGTYVIRVDTYGGIFEGEVEVTLTAADLYEATFSEDEVGTLRVAARLPRDGRYTYTFEAVEGEVLTLTARDTAFTLDPRLTLDRKSVV